MCPNTKLNAGKVSMNQKGDLKGYGMVWYYPDGIANVLSLYNVQKSTESLLTAPMKLGLWCIRKMVLLMYSNPPKGAFLH